MAKWSTAFMNDLPDSSFAFIEGGGTKDSDSKTTPRSLRHLPYKDENGKVDHAHTANALARLNQTQAIPASERQAIRATLQRALGTTHSAGSDDETVKSILSSVRITPGDDGKLPTRFPLLSTFDLPNSNRGHFKVSVTDLQEIKEKFDAGVYFPSEDTGTGLKIDLDHSPQVTGSTEAAAWIHALDVVPDPADPEKKGTLYADNVEWTDLGAEKVKSGRYKMISPTGSFGTRNGKYGITPHHTDRSIKLSNVLVGAGLTNEPFQSMMAPIRLSATDNLNSGYDNVIYVYSDEQKKEPSMNLDALRVKERDQLSVPELDYLGEHSEELSAGERSKFKLEAAADDSVSDDDKQTLAAIKDGSKKVVDATAQTAKEERLDRMESTIERYRKQEVTDLLDRHVKRGAIKKDQATIDGFWGKQLLSASGEGEQKQVKDALDALPSNDELAKEHGTGEDTQAGSTAREQLTVLAKQKVDAAAKEGKELLFADALKQVYREKKDLREQDSQESKARASVVGA